MTIHYFVGDIQISNCLFFSTENPGTPVPKQGDVHSRCGFDPPEQCEIQWQRS